jgi:hypothetical protein
MTDITVADLTQTTFEGTGVFDVLMRANKTHLDGEYLKNRIKGPEYSTVYLGALQSVMQTSLSFLFQRDKSNLELQILEQQILLAQVAVTKSNAELAILQANLAKIPLELAQITAQTNLVTQQTANATAELAIIQANALKVPAEIAQMGAQTSLIAQQEINAVSQELQIDAQTAIVTQQTANEVIQGTVLSAQLCKLQAEFDLIESQTLKSGSENTLLVQKVATEKAQTTSLGVDEDSILGRQKSLYSAQTDGYKRNSEEKAAQMLLDTWKVRRTTDETGTLASATNKLDDATIGLVVGKVLTGIGI